MIRSFFWAVTKVRISVAHFSDVLVMFEIIALKKERILWSNEIYP
jgi:hypothetical protein